MKLLKKLNKNLENISKRAHQWKICLSILTQQKWENKFYFQNKNCFTFIEKGVHSSSFQKYLGLVLDSKLNFNMHLKEKIFIVNICIVLLRKLRHSIPSKSLLSIYKAFLRSHLDYCGVIYDKPCHEKFIGTLESIQYNATLAITGAIKGASKEKLYNELSLEYLIDRQEMQRLCLFHKIFKLKSPKYLYDLIRSLLVLIQPKIINYPIF